MSFTTNTSNLSGKSTTNAFDIVANSITVNKNELVKGDLTVLGNTNIGTVSLENANVDYLTVNHFTATNPVPTTSGGTGLATIGAANQVLTVKPDGSGLYYQAISLTNPSVITGTGYTGNPTLSFGIESTGVGSTGQGFIRTGPTATAGLALGTSSATVFQLSSNFSNTSTAVITNQIANFTYNSTGNSGVFQVTNAGGAIGFTNSGVGTISLATAGGSILLADPSATAAVSITTAGGVFNLNTGIGALSMSTGVGMMSLTTGAGSMSLTTAGGSMNLTTGAGALNLTTGAGNISLTTAAAGIISLAVATAGAINIGTALGFVNLYGSAVTIGAPLIYIGIGGTTPVPSNIVFAAGTLTGATLFWNLTTGYISISSASYITLTSLSTITLNGSSTSLNGPTTMSGIATINGSNSGYTSAVLNVTNSSTSSGAIGSFLNSSMVSGQEQVLYVGKSLGTGQAIGLSYGYNSTGTSIVSTWGFYAEGSPRVTLQRNNTVTLSGTVNLSSYTASTLLGLDSSNNIVSKSGGSNTVYNTSADTLVANTTWISLASVTVLRQKGNGTLSTSTAGQFTNTTGSTLLVSISFSTQRVSNSFGVTSIRIQLNNTYVLAEQDVSSLDRVTVYANTYLDNNEYVQCQIWQNSGSTVSYNNNWVTINTYPIAG